MVIPDRLEEWFPLLDKCRSPEVANYFRDRTLRQVLCWLEEFEAAHHDVVDVIRIGRGHGLEMAAEELKTMLEAGS